MGREDSLVEQKRGIGIVCGKCGRPAKVTRWGKNLCWGCHDELLAVVKAGQTPAFIARTGPLSSPTGLKHAFDCVCSDCRPDMWNHGTFKGTNGTK